MAYKDVLPTTNLQAVDVRDTIGCPSNNLAHYCCMAKSGGKPYGKVHLAFETIEVGGSHVEGHLIAGATPYFNIYSNKAPGKWVIYVSGLEYRLKRNSYGSVNINGVMFGLTSYCYDAGEFRGYVAKSNAPYIGEVKGVNIAEENNLTVFFYRGDHDWFSVLNDYFEDLLLNELYVGIGKENNSKSDSEMIKYVDWAKCSTSTGRGSVTVPVYGKPTTISLYVKFFRKVGISAVEYLITLPMESSAIGNGGYKIPFISNIAWTDYYTEPRVTKTIFHTGPNESNYGEIVGTRFVEVKRSFSDSNYFHFAVRVCADKKLSEMGSFSGTIKYPASSDGTPGGIYFVPTVAMVIGANVTGAEASANPSLNVREETWIVSSSIPKGIFPEVATEPFDMTIKVFNIIFD